MAMYFDLGREKTWQEKDLQKKNKRLQNKVDKLKKQLRLHGVINWVAVKDKLPSHQTDVITYSKEFEIRNGRCMQKGTWFVNGYSQLVEVTHWAELPKPPCL